jgi:hypothetical protein
VKHVRARRSGKIHYWATRRWSVRNAEGKLAVESGEALLCWSPGNFFTRQVDDTDDPVDCQLCLVKHASIERRMTEFGYVMRVNFPLVGMAIDRVVDGLRVRGIPQPTTFTVGDDQVRLERLDFQASRVVEVLEASGFQCMAADDCGVTFDPHPERRVGPFVPLTGREGKS